MLGRVRDHLSYANVMATIAVFIALGGGAYALTRGAVKTKHIAPKAVKTSKLAPNERSQAYVTGQSASTAINSAGTVVATLTLPAGNYAVSAKAILSHATSAGAPTCEIHDDGSDVDRAAVDMEPGDTQTIGLVGASGGGTVTLVCAEDGGSTTVNTRRLLAERVAKVATQ